MKLKILYSISILISFLIIFKKIESNLTFNNSNFILTAT
jgi:hypothetical protein